MAHPHTRARTRAARACARVARLAIAFVAALLTIVPSAAHAAWSQQTEFGSRSQNGQLEAPLGMELDGSGNLYVADTVNNRVQVFNPSGNYVSQFGSTGTGNGQLRGPTDIAFDSSGNIFVLDQRNSRVQKFTSAGAYVSQFGSAGSGNGQFATPWSLAIDASDRVYVVDQGNNRVQRFTAAGAYDTKFGSVGTGAGQFATPTGIAIKSDGTIYVVDGGNNRVQKFNTSLGHTSTFGSTGQGNGQFNYPTDVEVDASGNVYVADYSNGRVQKFNASHTYQMSFGYWGFGSGTSLGSSAVEVDGSGNVYELSALLDKIVKFNAAGTYQSRFASNLGSGELSLVHQSALAPDGTLYAVDPSNQRVLHFSRTGAVLHTWGASGSGNGQFNDPYGVSVGRDGSVYVADSGNNRVQRFTSTGTYLSKFGSYGTGNGQLALPTAITTAADGTLYVSECGNDRVQRFTADGAHISKFGSTGSGNGQFSCPYGVGFGPDGSIFVLDEANRRVQKFTTGGSYLLQFGSSGSSPGQFGDPWGMSVAPNGDVYVSDWWYDRITRFNSNGAYQEVIGSTVEQHEATGFLGNTSVLATGNNAIWVSEGGANRLSYWSNGTPDSPPQPVASLAQLRADGTTPLPAGTWTNQTTAVLHLDVSDFDAAQTLTPWVEVRPIGVPLSATCGSSIVGVTFSGANVNAPAASTAYAASVTVTSLLPGLQYHWRACSVDQNGNRGTWISMGGSDGTRDFGVRAPGTLIVPAINDGTGADIDTQSSLTTLDANWSAAVDVNGADAVNYDWCFTTNATNGCAAGGRVAQGSATPALSVQATGLSLTPGTLYHFCVLARDASAATGPYTCSDGNLVAPLTSTVSGFATRGESGATPWTGCDGTNENLKLSVHGGALHSTSCNARTGAFTFTGVSMPGAGQYLVLYLDAAGSKGATYYSVTTGGGIGGLNVVQDRVVLASQAAAPKVFDATAFQVWDATDSAGAIPVDATTDPSRVTFGSATELHVGAGATYSPDAVAMTVGSVHVASGGTLHGVTEWTYSVLTGYGTSSDCAAGPHVSSVVCVDAGGSVDNSSTSILFDVHSTVNRPAAFQSLPDEVYDGIRADSTSTIVLGNGNDTAEFGIYTEIVLDGTLVSSPWNLDVTVPYLYVQGDAVWRDRGRFTVTTNGTFTGNGTVDLPNASFVGTGRSPTVQFGPESNSGEWTLGNADLRTTRTNHLYGTAGARTFNSGGINLDTPAAIVTDDEHTYNVVTSPGTSSDWVITRSGWYDGALDPGWDGDGVLALASAGPDVATSAALSLDRKLLVAGSMNGSWAVRKFNADGSPDTSFDGDGTWAPGITGTAKAIVVSLLDGSVFVAGEDASNAWQVRRIGANGGTTLSSASWNGDTGSGATPATVKAMCTTDTNWGAKNDVYVVGSVGSGSTDWAIGNFHWDGATWAWQAFVDGSARPGRIAAAGTADSANSCALDNEGTGVYVGGVSGNGDSGDNATVRAYSGSPGNYGVPISWYASSGVLTIDGGGRDYLNRVLLEGPNMFVIGGDATNGGRGSVMRYNMTGTRDPAFANGAGVAYWDPNVAGDDIAVDAAETNDHLVLLSRDSRNGGDATLTGWDENGVLQAGTTPGLSRYAVIGYSLDRLHVTGNLTVGDGASPSTALLDAALVYGPIDVDGDVVVRANGMLTNPSQQRLAVGGNLDIAGKYFHVGGTLELRPRSKNVNVNVTSTTTFSTLNVIGTHGSTTVNLDNGDPITVTNAFNAFGVSCTEPLRLRPIGSTWTLNTTGGVVSSNFLDVAGATMSPGRTVQNSYNSGSNTGVTFGGSSCAAPPLPAPDNLRTNGEVHAGRVEASPAPQFTFTNRAGSAVDRADVQVLSSHPDSVQSAYRFDDLAEANGGSALNAYGGYVPNYVTGKFGSALQFGTNVAELVYPGTQFAPPQEWTIDGWVKRGPLTGSDYAFPAIVFLGNGANKSYTIIFNRDANALCASTSFGGITENVCTDATSVTDNAWHHVAYTYRDHTMRLVVDGVERASARNWGVPDSGAWFTTYGQGLNGAIDDWQVRSVGDDLDTVRGYFNTNRRHFDTVWSTSLASIGAVGNGGDASVTFGGAVSALAREGARYWVRARTRTTVGSTYTNWSRPDWFATRLNALSVSLPDGNRFDLGLLAPGVDATVPLRVDVTTTAEGGWSMYGSGEDDTYALSNGVTGATNQFARRTTALWPAGTPGYAGLTVLSAPGGKSTTTWGTGVTSSDFTNLRYAWPALTTPTLLHTYASYDTATRSVQLSARANAATNTRAGAYAGRLEFTVVPNA